VRSVHPPLGSCRDGTSVSTPHMTGFARSPASGEPVTGVLVWRGNPHQAVHDFLLADLVARGAPFLSERGAPVRRGRGYGP
jgi:hypothetical protein